MFNGTQYMAQFICALIETYIHFPNAINNDNWRETNSAQFKSRDTSIMRQGKMQLDFKIKARTAVQP